jgi:trimeric autotransporter adhesin
MGALNADLNVTSNVALTLATLPLQLSPANPFYTTFGVAANGQLGSGTLTNDQLPANLGAGIANTSVGWQALATNQNGSYNVAVGFMAMPRTIGASDGTSHCTAVGYTALFKNTTGNYCTGLGVHAGYTNSTGNLNTYVGAYSGFLGDTGNDNTGLGQNSLYHNVSGSYNTALGVSALSAYTNSNATAVGYAALANNVSGTGCTAVGFSAAAANTANGVTAVGSSALVSATGVGNTAVGVNAFFTNTSAANNTGMGQNVMYYSTGVGNTAIGYQAGYTIGSGAGSSTNHSTSGTYNTFLGYQTGPSSTTPRNYQTVIGAAAAAVDVANSVTLGQIGTDTPYMGPAVIGVSANTLTYYTIAQLLAISAPVQGMRAFVVDTVGSATPSYRLQVAGSGGTTVADPVYYDGSVWRFG